MMKMVNRISLYVMLLLILGLPFLFKSYVEYELKSYAYQTYNVSMLASPVELNWMTMNFESQVNINEIEYSLIYSVFDFQIMDDYLYFAETEKFNNSFLDWSSHLPNTTIVEGSIIVNVDAFNYSNTSSMLYLSIKNSSKSLQSSSVDQMAATASDCIKFLKKEYKISGIQVIYFDFSGGYTTVIPYSPWRKEINLAKLIQKAYQLNSNDLGEAGLKWIEDNNNKP